MTGKSIAMSIDHIKTFIASGNLKKAIDELLNITQNTEIHNKIILQSARLSNLRKEERMGIISESNSQQTRAQITYAILEYLSEISYDENANSANKFAELPTVFISYNHKDIEIAERVKQKLEITGISVAIDSESMHAGEDIKLFIERCIRENDITLSLVSNNSLISAWVAMETILTTTGEVIANKKFIPCSIDQDFFNRSFTDEVLDIIEHEIADIDNTIQKRRTKQRGIEDLQNELSRYIQLKNNLPEIIRRLKESLTTDISGENFDTGMLKIISTILQR
ncbi:TIR domain-containing protein [Chondrinema litorale]|uniref:TIR domain-containing protein n=1 Tax=Chondrinema litorale TaxID=2994555 RepID=UPI0025434C28|nr:TIR domain-containing protein [Chondrinema litorale]UZR93177.1 TIR domain-containing protein [Chondrinema litorale]